MSNQVITFPVTRREAKAGTTPDVTTFTTPDHLGGFAIRVIEINGKPWFVAADVCRALGRGNVPDALEALDPDQKGMAITPTPGGPQRLSVVSESGLYLIAMQARRQGQAKRFQDWVTREVLPAIRKDGGYIMGEEKLRTGEMSEDEFIARAFLTTHRKLERVTAERDQFAAENAQLASRNAVLKHLRDGGPIPRRGEPHRRQIQDLAGESGHWAKSSGPLPDALHSRPEGAPDDAHQEVGHHQHPGQHPRQVLAEACALLGYIKRIHLLAQLMTHEEWRVMLVWAPRSCGDCSNGPPCRCHPGNFMDLLNERGLPDSQRPRV